jgi:hypothetical protein
MLLGATLVAERADPGAAETGGDAAPVFFFEGRLEGEHFPGWSFVFSVAGRRAQGFAFNPATGDGELRGLRFEGRVRDHELLMDVFGLEDPNHLRALGRLGGSGERGVVEGTLVLPERDYALGHFRAWGVPVSPKASQRLVGTYQAAASGPDGAALYGGALVIRPGYRWELRNIRAAPGLPTLAGGAMHRLAGRYSVAVDGRLLLNMTRVPVRLRRPPGGVGENAGRREAAPSVKPAAGLAAAPAAVGAGRVTAGPVLFSDGTFANGDWTATKIADATPEQSGVFDAEQVAEGGNPGAFRRVTLSFAGAGIGANLVDVASIREAFVYDPKASGPLGSVSSGYDLIGLNEVVPPVTCRYFTLLRQGDSYYHSIGAFDGAPPGGWQRSTHVGLRQSNFVRVAGAGPSNPDFSGAGAPIHFGYMFRGITVKGAALCITGLDNYALTATPEESFRTLALDGSDEPPAGLEVEYVATVREAGGKPAPGEPVLFHLEVEGVTVREASAETDGSGRARFRHTFPRDAANDRFLLTACVDENRNGSCEPLEPSDAIGGFVEGTSVRLEGPESAEPGAQVCYTVTTQAGGIELPDQAVLLMQEGVETPLAQGTTGAGGDVQLCFSAPATPAELVLFACWDQNGSGACDAGDLASRRLTLVVASPPPPADVACEECCLTNLIVALQTPSVRATAVRGFVIEHPFTHLVGVFTRRD